MNTACYESTPSIAAWLKKNGLSADGGYEYFVKRYQAIAHSKGRDVAGWEEIWKHFGTELAKSTIIHQWLPGSTMSVEATQKGYRCLWSTDGVWYLDGLGTTWQYASLAFKSCLSVSFPSAKYAHALCTRLMVAGRCTSRNRAPVSLTSCAAHS